MTEKLNLGALADEALNLLLSHRTPGGWWQGELSTSALSTATATMALALAAEQPQDSEQQARFKRLVQDGLEWLVEHQNEDGGWGDTVLSISNISTTMLVDAVLQKAQVGDQFQANIIESQAYITDAGGVDAVIRRYGKDRTFSVPILTHCALAGVIDWKQVRPLPFELSCIPTRFYAAVRMPVVSYALPALIAIGQVIFHHRGHWNPLMAWVRRASVKRSLRVLSAIQPENGGFLEATPLTSFVCMSLLGCGQSDHIVTQRCLDFIENSVRPDGSWPIDTSLTTWVTTLSVNAMAGDSRAPESHRVSKLLTSKDRAAIRDWLIDQQYKEVHPYTNSPPGGWSWIDLPGGVPDADDTPGAILAILNLRPLGEDFTPAESEALRNAVVWLQNLQNRDGGWPTFCRGWGTLPFDRSSNDLTAHVLRSFVMWQSRMPEISGNIAARCEIAIAKGLRFLEKNQTAEGSWLPLWFGNQFNENDENPLYGTAKVTLALRECGQEQSQMARRGLEWLISNQNEDGGWSARFELESSAEETGLALEALAGVSSAETAVKRGLLWIQERMQQGRLGDPSPIGFYFAKLWYFERLYPIIFTTAAVRRCTQTGGFDS